MPSVHAVDGRRHLLVGASQPFLTAVQVQIEQWGYVIQLLQQRGFYPRFTKFQIVQCPVVSDFSRCRETLIGTAVAALLDQSKVVGGNL